MKGVGSRGTLTLATLQLQQNTNIRVTHARGVAAVGVITTRWHFPGTRRAW